MFAQDKRFPDRDSRLHNILRSELWFTDGNVIISPSSVAFRFTAASSGRHSEVFDDLFSIPQPKDQICTMAVPGSKPTIVLPTCSTCCRALYDGLAWALFPLPRRRRRPAPLRQYPSSSTYASAA
ncbi:hypothetical protein B0H14DRAFT_3539453 [Mycena olivaceomarginata]|nr:hypothetical protein B0H14DRAFT_3539453 [Mycena olivaceomarginata]